MNDEEIQFAIGADTRPFTRGMRALQRGVAAQGEAIGKGLQDGFKKGFNIADITKQFAAGFGVMFAVAKGEQFLTSITQLTEEIKRNAEAVGVSTDFYQGWEHAASTANVTAEMAAKSLALITEAIGDARDGNEDAIRKFERLGVSLTNIDGSARSTELVVLDVATALAGIEDPASRAAIASELLGKAWSKSLPMLLQGGDAIKKLVEEASKLSKGDLEAIDQLSTSWKSFVKSLQVEAGTVIGVFSRMGKVIGDSIGPDMWEQLKSHMRSTMGSPELTRLNKHIEQIANSVYGFTPESDPAAGPVASSGEKARKAAIAKVAEEMAKAEAEIAKINGETADARKTDEERLNDLLMDRSRLEDESADASQDQAKWLQHQLDAAKNQLAIEKLQLSVEDDRLRKTREIERAQLAANRAGADIVQSAIDADTALNNAIKEATGLSVADVAEMPIWRNDPNFGQKQLANQILDAEDNALAARDMGDIAGFKAWVDEGLRLRTFLDDNIFKPSEVDQFKAMREHLEGLIELARGPGININPKNGK